MTQLSLPITYRSSTKKMLLLFVVSLVFVAGGIAVARERPMEGYGGAALFGVCALVGLVSLHPKASYLELTEKGFTICSMFWRTFVPWSHVREFYPVRIHLHSMVGWNYSDGYHQKATARRLAKALAGSEGALPDTYGMAAEELAAKLNAMLAKSMQ